MVAVRVRYFNILRQAVGFEHEEVTLSTGMLLDALEQIGKRHGSRLQAMLFSADGDISPHLVIFCNQRLLDGDRRYCRLTEGDELMLFPAISGGAHSVHRKGDACCLRF